MKAATTTLYADLYPHPQIFLPEEKEPSDLISDIVLSPPGRSRYLRAFSRASVTQIAGEASTAYSKRPDYEGVAERALSLLGPDLKIIYIVREPVQRMLSQYRHVFQEGRTTLDVTSALLADPSYVNYSRYSFQLEPWLAAFGADHILVLRFEDYVHERKATVATVCRFLGIGVHLGGVDTSAVHNSSADRLVPRSTGWGRLATNRFYQRSIKRWLPKRLRAAFARIVFSPGRRFPVSTSIDETTRDELRSRLSADDLGLAANGHSWLLRNMEPSGP